MKHLLGYLQLTGPGGGCVELVNGARTLALMSREPCRVHPAWRTRTAGPVWPGNACWAFDSGQYGATAALWADPLGDQDPNPWEDADNPATLEVAGFLPDAPAPGVGVILESPTEARVIGSTRVEPLELIVTGTVVAGSARGESAWLQWANRVLTDPTAYRMGWSATVFTHCPDEADWAAITDPFDLPPLDPGAPAPAAGWDDPDPPVLEAYTGETPWPIDAGLWQLFDVRFVSIDPLNDQPLFDHCVGRRYALRFTVGRHWAYDRPRTLATLGGAGAWAAGEAYTTPLDVGDPTPVVDPYDVGPGVRVPATAGTWSGLRARPARWAMPDSVLRVAALTPPRATTLQDRLVITVRNPSVEATVYNARVRLWEAFVGQPPPDTVVGDAFYRERTPAAELRFVRIGPGETITFDGRTNRATLQTSQYLDVNVPGRVEAPSGARVELPTLECNYRYWVAAELSSATSSRGDLDLEVTVQAAQQSIPT